VPEESGQGCAIHASSYRSALGTSQGELVRDAIDEFAAGVRATAQGHSLGRRAGWDISHASIIGTEAYSVDAAFMLERVCY